MIDALKFVQGAVSKKNFVQALTHFNIADHKVIGYNGTLALCSPIDLDLNVTPKATPFIKAIQTCKKTVQLNMTPGGRLSIKSGPFKAIVDCTEEEFPDIKPEGEAIELPGDFLQAIKDVSPFIADDASRQWARGILFRGQSVLATNNVVLIEHWLPYKFPVEVNVPKPAIQELLRIGEEPTHLQVNETSITFHFSSGAWLRTQTYTTEWPDICKILDRQSNQTPFQQEFFTTLDDLEPFVDDLGRVYLSENRLSTVSGGETGASVELEGVHAEGIYNLRQLSLLEGLATTIDFTQYPAPSLFYGDSIRGVIIGMRE